MLIDYASDIHFEHGGITELMFHPEKGWKPNPGSEVLVLAGDITEIELLCGKSTRSVFVQESFQKWSSQYKHVIWVFGNHEYYRETINYAIPHARKKLEVLGCKNVTILNNRVLEIDNVAFFGGTAWTNFNNFNPVDMVHASSGLNDYNFIKVYDTQYGGNEKRKLSVHDVELLHRAWKRSFDDFLNFQTNKTKVLITHHAPSFMSVQEHYKSHHLNGSFASEYGDSLSYSDIKLAIHGHIHFGVSEYKLGDCLVVSNTRGYFGAEAGSANFRPKQIEV